MNVSLPPSEFDDIWLKFARADDHLETLKALLLEIIEDEASSGIRIEFDREDSTWQAVANLPGIERVDPEWSLLIGEILYHLRSILDHLINAIVPTTTKDTGFPIRDTEASFDNDTGRSLEGIEVGSIDWTVTKVLQPFCLKPEDPRVTTPWGLNELARLDRHRFIHTSGLWITEAQITFEPPGAASVDYMIETPAALADGLLLASGRLIDTHRRLPAVQCIAVPDLALTSVDDFRGSSTLEGILVIEGLQHFMGFVAGAIAAYEDPVGFLVAQQDALEERSSDGET